MDAIVFLLVGINLLGVPVMLFVALRMLGGLREDVDEINCRLQWIGPAQCVYVMMFWDVVAALGLVALYLAFVIGHRYFSLPVIESFSVAFAGLVAVVSLRFKSVFEE